MGEKKKLIYRTDVDKLNSTALRHIGSYHEEID
jgi:hypothetical protein